MRLLLTAAAAYLGAYAATRHQVRRLPRVDPEVQRKSSLEIRKLGRSIVELADAVGQQNTRVGSTDFSYRDKLHLAGDGGLHPDGA